VRLLLAHLQVLVYLLRISDVCGIDIASAAYVLYQSNSLKP
jgi:hypothetical protein